MAAADDPMFALLGVGIRPGESTPPAPAAAADEMIATPADLIGTDYVQGPTGVTNLTINGPQPMAHFILSGSATLAGTLNLTFAPAFPQPTGVTSYDLLTAPVITGTWDTVTFAGLPAADSERLIYTPTDISILVTPVPEPAVLPATGLAAAAALGRRRRRSA